MTSEMSYGIAPVRAVGLSALIQHTWCAAAVSKTPLTYFHEHVCGDPVQLLVTVSIVYTTLMLPITLQSDEVKPNIRFAPEDTVMGAEELSYRTTPFRRGGRRVDVGYHRCELKGSWHKD